jgi:transposase-like protein
MNASRRQQPVRRPACWLFKMRDTAMNCRSCLCQMKKNGCDRKGNQRYKCNNCGHGRQERFYRAMNLISSEKEAKIAELLNAGISIREIAKRVGVHKNTVLTRAASLLPQPSKSSGKFQCDYCGGEITKPREAHRRNPRTTHKYCSFRCMNADRAAGRDEGLAQTINAIRILKKEILNGKVRSNNEYL